MDMSEQTDPQPEEPQEEVQSEQSEEKETAAVELVTVTAESTESTELEVPAPPAPPKRRERKPGKGRPGAGKSGKSQSSLRQVADRFAACGRCSYFWAGYKVLFGDEGQETAVNQSESGWLDLQWNFQMFDLLHKSYGVRLDIEYFHYEGCCKECRRRFVYHAAENENESPHCSIEISPHRVK